MNDRDSIRRYRSNLQGEIDSAALYRALAEAETKPQLKEVYGRLAAVEEAHAQFWQSRLQRLGVSASRRVIGWRSRLLGWLAQRLGPDAVLPVINTLERADVTQYDTQPEAVAAGLPAAERSHARIVQAAEQSVRGGLSGGALASLEGRRLLSR